jgi:hypothetical protein
LLQAAAALALLACDSAPANVPTAQPEPENLPIVQLPSTIVPTAEPEAVRLPTVQPPTAIGPAESPPASAPTAALSAPTGPTALSQSVRIPLIQQPNVAPTALPQVVRIPLIQQPDRGVAPPPPAGDPKCASGGRAAYGKGSPDVEAKLQQALAAAHISASARTGTQGQTDGCGVFHAAALDVGLVVQAQSLSDQSALAALVTQIDGIVRQVHDQTKAAPNLGKLQISFTANGATCAWDAGSNACRF